MLIYSMGVSADGFIADEQGGFDFTAPGDEQFRFQVAQIGRLGGYLMGRKLYETMRVWETDESLRTPGVATVFADTWAALPKVVFSRTLTSVDGNARLATGTVEDEVAAALASTAGDVSIGGADLAAEAIHLDLIDEYRLFRYPVVIGNGTRYWPPLERRMPLTLVGTRTFGGRVVYEEYRRLRYDVTPGSVAGPAPA
ncbi:deaminase [Leifsonia xyli]|uniref:dihydrofolate reductase family protein n=1 Tax=Leifsonia xyli TaxID=1575 RepID=UPI0007CDA859|nr:deaminase [Leifsonia xyli]